MEIVTTKNKTKIKLLKLSLPILNHPFYFFLPIITLAWSAQRLAYSFELIKFAVITLKFFPLFNILNLGF